MFYLVGRMNGKAGMIMSSPQKAFLEGLREATKEKHPSMKFELIPGIDYEEFLKEKKKT